MVLMFCAFDRPAPGGASEARVVRAPGGRDRPVDRVPAHRALHPAITAARMEELRYQASARRSSGVEVEEVGSDGVVDLRPPLDPTGVVGATWSCPWKGAATPPTRRRR